MRVTSPLRGLNATMVGAELTRWLTPHALFATSRLSHFACGCALQPAEWHWTFEASLAASLGQTTFLVEDRVVSPLLESGWSRVAST